MHTSTLLTHRLGLVVWVLLLTSISTGCSVSRLETDLPPQYAAAAESETVLSAPVYDLSGEPGLNGFISEISNAFMRHDWRDLSYMLHPSDYAEQFSFIRNGSGSDAEAVAQVLEETFSLRMIGNVLLPNELRRANRPFDGLNRIRGVQISSVEPRGEYFDVEGTVTLDDRTSRSLSFAVSRATGTWQVVVAMG